VITGIDIFDTNNKTVATIGPNPLGNGKVLQNRTAHAGAIVNTNLVALFSGIGPSSITSLEIASGE
jgi:hypothetical protein